MSYSGSFRVILYFKLNGEHMKQTSKMAQDVIFSRMDSTTKRVKSIFYFSPSDRWIFKICIDNTCQSIDEKEPDFRQIASFWRVTIA